jgi:hypothetical protein
VLRGGHSSVSLSVSAESEKLWLSHMRIQFAWACIAQGALFESHQIMAVCFLAAILECLSVHRRDASAVVLFCMRTAGRQRLRATEKSAIMRWSQACRGAASMHVGIVPAVWPHVRDPCFLLVASSYTCCFRHPVLCPGLFLWCFLVSLLSLLFLCLALSHSVTVNISFLSLNPSLLFLFYSSSSFPIFFLSFPFWFRLFLSPSFPRFLLAPFAAPLAFSGFFMFF